MKNDKFQIQQMAKKIISEEEKQLLRENKELRTRLYEVERALNAIRNGEVDAIVGQGDKGESIYSLTSAETPYRIIFEEMNEGSVILKADGTILYCNRRFAELVSVSQEQTMGANIYQFISVSEKEKFDGLLKTSIETSCRGEIQYSTPEGDVHYFQLSISPLPTSIIGDLCMMVTDITDRKLAEEKLLKSEEFHRSLFNMMNGFAYCKINYMDGLACDFTYLIVNKAFEELTGLENVVGKKVSAIIPQIHEIDPDLLQLYERVASSGNSESFEIYLKSLKKWFSISVYSPEKEYFIAVFEVITERKQAEMALRQSELKYRELVENSPDAIVIYAQGKIVMVNSEALHLMNASNPDELIGKQVIQFVHPDYKEFVMGRMEKMANNEVVLPLVEEKFIRPDGAEIDIEVKAISIRFDNKPAALLIIRDITERKQLENAIRESEEKYRTIFSTETDALFLINQETYAIVEVNEAACQLYGYSEEEMLKLKNFEWLKVGSRVMCNVKLQMLKRLRKLKFNKP